MAAEMKPIIGRRAWIDVVLLSLLILLIFGVHFSSLNAIRESLMVNRRNIQVNRENIQATRDRLDEIFQMMAQRQWRVDPATGIITIHKDVK